MDSSWYENFIRGRNISLSEALDIINHNTNTFLLTRLSCFTTYVHIYGVGESVVTRTEENMFQEIQDDMIRSCYVFMDGFTTPHIYSCFFFCVAAQ